MDSVWAASKPFVTGSLSGMVATCCIQPIDMVKVRIQLLAGTADAAGPLSVASKIIKNEGFFSLYRGLSAGLTRQVVYTGARLGLFDTFKSSIAKPGKPLGFLETSVCALSAGGIAAVIGNPADLALIRMQADSLLPEAERRGYKHVGDALSSIVRTEGVGGLFAGALPTSTRAMALNFGMLAFNDQSKKILSSLGVVGPAQLFGASAIAGFFASAFGLPFDFVKTQMQKQNPNEAGELPFKNSMDCVRKTMAEGGFLRFYAGFPTFYVRIAPHAMITLIAQDQIKDFWARNNM